MIIHVIFNIKNNLINSMMIYIVENKRLSKIESVRIYNIKYKNKSKIKGKIQHTIKSLNKYIQYNMTINIIKNIIIKHIIEFILNNK